MLSLRQHVSYTSKTCQFHLRNISRIRKYIPQDTSVVLVKSLVMSRLDYSNDLFYGLPKCTVSGLQAVQNSAARIVTQERLQDHDSMSRALIGLHWLPVDKRIEYIVCLVCGANSRFLGLVSVWAARSFDQTALRPSVIKRIRQIDVKYITHITSFGVTCVKTHV